MVGKKASENIAIMLVESSEIEAQKDSIQAQ